MPTGDAETILAMLRITLVGGVVTLCLLLPGWEILRLISRDACFGLTPFRKIGYSLVGSTVVLCALQSASFFLPPMWVRFADLVFLAVCLFVAVVRLRTWRGGWRAWLQSEYRFLGGTLLIVTLVILWGHASASVPGPLEAGYGDLASYYRAIDNLSRGSFPLIDFRIADFDGEVYFMPTVYPVLMLLSTCFKIALPDIQHFLPVVVTLIGSLGLFFCGGYLYEKFAADRVDGELALFSLGLVPLLFATHSRHFVLGALTLPVMTLSLILIDLVCSPWSGSRHLRTALIVSCSIVTAFMRPEGFLLVLLLASLHGLSFLIKQFSSTFIAIKTALAAGFILFLLSLAFAPYQHVLGKSFSFVYLHYNKHVDGLVFDDARKPIDPHQDTGCYYVMYDHARERVGLPRNRTEINPSFFISFREHPRAYFAWLAKELIEQLGLSMLIVISGVTLILLFSRHLQYQILGILAPIYFAVLTSINPAFSTRHTWPIATLLLAAAIRSLQPAIGIEILRSVTGRFAQRLALIAALTALWLAGVEARDFRREERASSHVAILEHLRPRIESSTAASKTVVASTYPQLISYALDVVSVGSAYLPELVEPFIEEYSPDILVLDSGGLLVRHRPGFDAAKIFLESGKAEALGYELVTMDVAQRYMILERRTRPWGQ